MGYPIYNGLDWFWNPLNLFSLFANHQHTLCGQVGPYMIYGRWRYVGRGAASSYDLDVWICLDMFGSM